jgi:hypothetical protein
MLRFRARLLALVAAIALMLPSGALARASYFCRMMERSVSSCCCAHARAKLAKQTKRQTTVQAPSCCDRLTAPSRANGSAVSDGAPQVPSAALAAVLPHFLLAPLAEANVTAFAPSARAPPSVGPPLFLSHCSFLI